MLAGYAAARLETVAATWRRQRRLTRETRRQAEAALREETAKTGQAWWWHGMGGYESGDLTIDDLPPFPEWLIARPKPPTE
jgi:hypothetical protein